MTRSSFLGRIYIYIHNIIITIIIVMIIIIYIYKTKYIIIRYVSCMSVIVPSYIPTSISVASTAPSP